MKNYFWLICIFLIYSCNEDLSNCQKFGDIEPKLYSKVETLLNNGEYSKGLQICDSLVRIDSNNYVAVNLLGVFHYRICQKNPCSDEELKEVLFYYKKSIDICDNYRIGYFNLIELFSEMHEYGEVIRYLKIYNDRYPPKRGNLQFQGGRANYHLGHLEEAFILLNEALELGFEHSNVYSYLSKYYSDKKDYDTAFFYLNESIQLDSTSLAFNDRGYIYLELGEFEKAAQDYNTAIGIWKKRFESYIGLALMEFDNNNIQEGCDFIWKAMENGGSENKVVLKYLRKYCNETKKI